MKKLVLFMAAAVTVAFASCGAKECNKEAAEEAAPVVEAPAEEVAADSAVVEAPAEEVEAPAVAE